MLRRESSRAWEHAVLGGFLGLALLANFSALVPLGLCTSVLLVQRWLAGRRSVAEQLRLFGTTFAVVLAICGWHYLRVAMHFGGNPFVGNWDAASGYAWWQDPGYHVFEDFTRFGLALERPLQSAVASVPDALYSTFWGDGMIGGSGFPHVTPPWRLEWMAAGYALALGPCLALLLGCLLACVDFVRAPRAERLLSIARARRHAVPAAQPDAAAPVLRAGEGLLRLVGARSARLLLRARLRCARPARARAGAVGRGLARGLVPASCSRPSSLRAERLRGRSDAARHPDRSGGWLAKASHARTRGQPEEAIDALRHALEVDPDQGRAGPVLVEAPA